ncbi:ZN862-like protein [Mya arenaria]|uniref:ZN862-like protein n=1 Tax=Mya arenaria TaxID=6604 RepID=A0ABY7ET32_MYAAR|nr:ZN862-like protein [Mya arenaria]
MAGMHLTLSISKGIDIKNMVGISTDGASVMTGKKGGVVKLLRDYSPVLVGVHCAAHRVALATSQAAKLIPEMNDFSRRVTNVFRYFHNSALRSNRLRDIQTVLNLPQLKFAEVHSVRWLSLEAAVRAIYRTYPALVMCLEADATTEPAAKGLLHEVSQFRFIALTHLLMDVLPFLTRLSLKFQSKSLDFGTVNTEVSSTCESLEDLIECDGAFTDKLAGFVKEVDGKTFYDRPVCESESGNVLDTIQCNVIFDGFDPVEEPEEEPEEILEGQDEAGFKPELRYFTQQKGLLGRLGPQYISRVVENVRDRFQDIPIVDSMSVLVPSNIASSVSIAKYGLVQFKCLVEHFKPFIGSPEMCLSEFSEYKRLVAKAYTTLGLLDITKEADAQVTFEDQQKINKFARTNVKLGDIKDELKNKKKDLENLEIAEEEMRYH